MKKKFGTVAPQQTLTEKLQLVYSMTAEDFLRNNADSTLFSDTLIDKTIWEKKARDTRNSENVRNLVYSQMTLHQNLTPYELKQIQLAHAVANIEHFKDCLGTSDSRFPNNPVPVSQIASTFGINTDDVEMVASLLNREKDFQKCKQMYPIINLKK